MYDKLCSNPAREHNTKKRTAFYYCVIILNIWTDLFSCYYYICLLYTSDAADDLLCVDLGGRRIIKKKKK